MLNDLDYWASKGHVVARGTYFGWRSLSISLTKQAKLRYQARLAYVLGLLCPYFHRRLKKGPWNIFFYKQKHGLTESKLGLVKNEMEVISLWNQPVWKLGAGICGQLSHTALGFASSTFCFNNKKSCKTAGMWDRGIQNVLASFPARYRVLGKRLVRAWSMHSTTRERSKFTEEVLLLSLCRLFSM